jgi:diphthine synthase
MLYLIGLGLNVDGISKYGLDVALRCKKVYLENYTVEFPYTEGELKEKLGLKKIIPADREFVESEKIVDEAQKQDVALLIYGSPLTATTHISLINEAKRMGVKHRVVYAGSVFDAVAETGLQIYKFGKVASMPNFEADSFLDVVEENQRIGAHSLILVDIGLDFQNALEKLSKFSKKKIVVCSRLAARAGKIHYKFIEELREFSGIKAPFCFVLPGKMHFLEKEVLEGFS